MEWDLEYHAKGSISMASGPAQATTNGRGTRSVQGSGHSEIEMNENWMHTMRQMSYPDVMQGALLQIVQ